MEGIKNMRRIVAMALMVMLVFPGQASAGFKICFGGCMLKCVLKTRKPLACAVQCLKNCFFHSNTTPNPHYYCQLGCSINECAVKYSHDPEKMETCVEDCSFNVCTQE